MKVTEIPDGTIWKTHLGVSSVEALLSPPPWSCRISWWTPTIPSYLCVEAQLWKAPRLSVFERKGLLCGDRWASFFKRPLFFSLTVRWYLPKRMTSSLGLGGFWFNAVKGQIWLSLMASAKGYSLTDCQKEIRWRRDTNNKNILSLEFWQKFRYFLQSKSNHIDFFLIRFWHRPLCDPWMAAKANSVVKAIKEAQEAKVHGYKQARALVT